MKTPMIEAALGRMADFGILPDKGITLVPHDVLSQALGRIVVDERVQGMFILNSILTEYIMLIT
jgi:hypothetical protein